MAHTLTTCTFCGVGCGIYLETSGDHIIGVYPSISHPTNAGRICLRGWHVHEIATSSDRLKAPLIKKKGQFEEVSWDEAFDYIATRLRAIYDEHGPEALAFLNSPRCSNEEAYLLQKLARTVFGTNNVDHGTGVYCNNSIDVLLEMLGVSATTNSIAELAQSEVIVVDGVDLARRMPTLGGIVIRAKLQGARLIVIGTRRHRIAESADYFLQIKPDTEVFLYGAMAKVIDDRGLGNLAFVNRHCTGYEDFIDQVRRYDLLQAAQVCGVPADMIEEAAVDYATAKSAALLYSSSMETRSKEAIRAAVNLALLTGNLGKTGAGVFALSEQNNLQGVCDMGMLPDRLPGYVSVTDADARKRFETAWGCELPEFPGVDARQVLKNRGEERIRAAWLCRYDPVSTASFDHIAKLLSDMDLVVIQHLFATATSRCAHVILPTTAFGEEQVSFTNMERRIQLAEQAVRPEEGLAPAWMQIAEVARRAGADWKYRSSAEVMDEIRSLVPAYEAASYENLQRHYGRQWPCTTDHPSGTTTLFARNGDAQPAARFKFVPVPVPPTAALAPKEFPFTLVFGHSLYYWNQNVLIRHSETLKREYQILLLDYPRGFVEINSDDAKQLSIRDGERIRLVAGSGSAISAARVTHEVARGTIYVPYFVRDVEEQILKDEYEGTVPVRIEKVWA